MEPMRLRRQVRLKNLEAFRVRRGYFGPTICFMLIADYARPSTLDDFPYLKGVEDEDDFGRANFIRVLILHDTLLDAEHREEITNIAGGFLENKDACDWNTVFETLEPQEARNMEESRIAMLTCFERILRQYGFAAALTTISEDKFNYLSQD